MIDIVQNTQRNLKNIQQIGSTDEEDKIYIEQRAYNRIHEEELDDKRVFVLMGHTECVDGRYTTFAEAAIPVRGMEFSMNLPRWNNHSWSEVFKEIKRAYEDYIIVGWAMDIKGMPPKINRKLESIHREQFGGAHQILFLVDSLEKEEYFYVNKKNQLRQKKGFYIYYQPDVPEPEEQVDVEVELPKQQEIPDYRVWNAASAENHTQPRYREAMRQSNDRHGLGHFSSYVAGAAIVILLCLVGVGAYRAREQMFGLQNAITTLATQQANTQEPETSTVEVEKIPGIVTDTQEKKLEKSSQTTEQEENRTSENSTQEQSETQASEVAAAPSDVQSVQTKPTTYTVEKGDTIMSIARKLYGGTDRISEICALNGISNPNEIYYGQVLNLPES